MLKAHLIAVMTGWYESVIQKEEEEILSILKRDYEAKVEMNKKMKPEEFEGLYRWRSLYARTKCHHVLLIPHNVQTVEY